MLSRATKIQIIQIRQRRISVTTDFLKCLLIGVRGEFFASQFGPAFLRGQTISYVITVPTIWTEPAKDLTRKVAEKAGIPEGSLWLSTEPEASVQLFAIEPISIPGIVCDAGACEENLKTKMARRKASHGLKMSNMRSIPMTRKTRRRITEFH